MNTATDTSLQEWIDRIRDQDMPVFGRTARNVMAVTEDENAPAAELAKVILEDASMTARVLKLANSTFFNPMNSGISTVSRAVIVLGFNTVQNMSLSISLVDSFVRGTSRQRLTEELARSVHAAVQARTIAAERNDKSPEEVFIATLLLHLGDMAFWCFAGEIGDELDELLRRPDMTPEKAQEQVLGFKLRQLTSGLAQDWRLNELLRHTLTHPDSKDPRSRCVAVSYDLAVTCERYGWHAEETRAVLKEVAKLAQLPVKQATELAHRNARDAARVAGYYGAKAASEAIPQPNRYSEGEPGKADAAPVVEEAPAPTPPPSPYPQPDGMLQLKILRELSLLLESRVDFNLMMELVLEGMYRGIGMDRTLFALLTPDRRAVKAKYALGEDSKDLNQHFHFLRRPEQPNIFFQIMDKRACVWFDQERRAELKRLVPPAVQNVIGLVPFFTCPIVVNGQAIGLFYADRGPSGRALDDEAYDSFKHFAKQANMGLSLAASRRKPG